MTQLSVNTLLLICKLLYIVHAYYCTEVEQLTTVAIHFMINIVFSVHNGAGLSFNRTMHEIVLHAMDVKVNY